ncbi:acetylcholinesterase precursor [Boeremia exigua]|uniref:acetylcholinesterase precursor n=1 Tax=Boeremia exigua TaxID=749465 RepID=UPI001E8DDF4A|nr:acetylcholinesterase precursor [Boeremia exigua]KAH6637835.1 acetylcholinesterase precursor [Boeremia exigua]
MPGPSVQLAQGVAVGTTLDEEYPRAVEAFRGIPYALPPTGELRFRPPVKVPKGNERIDATKFGYRAPAQQFIKCGPTLEESEDCLTVNVFRQAQHSGSSPLPVAVYIHGGAFNRGTAAGHNTASMVGFSELPFIGVSFGYRIGALGFLPSRLSALEGALNLGLKDQIYLLDWVEENIHHFGGDKNNVTLVGLSAGAHSIGHHLLNYEESRPPKFHRVIIESGAPTSRAVRQPDADIHEQQFKDFLEAVDTPASLHDSEVFSYLRSLPTETIAQAQTKVFQKYNPSLRWAFQPVIDKEVIRGRPIDAWRTGRWHKMPIMTGFQGNEGSLYVNKKMSTSSEFSDFWRMLLPQLSDDEVQAIDQLYPDPEKVPESIYKETRLDHGVGAQYKRIEAAYAHYAYVAPVRQTAFFASQDTSVYLYHWALKRNIVEGARHADNMFFEMRDPEICALAPSLDELSGTLHAYITSFICTGSPNTLGGTYSARPVWSSYNKQDPKLMIFGKDNTQFMGGKDIGEPAVLVADEFGREESEFWWSKVELSQQ